MTPVCPGCGNLLKLAPFWHQPETSPVTQNTPKKVPTFGYKGQGKFCTLRCGYDFAVRIVDEVKR